MSLLNPYQILLGNLAGRIPRGTLCGLYMPKEQARELLMEETGQDFGYDVEKWREWLRRNKAILPRAERLRDSDFD